MRNIVQNREWRKKSQEKASRNIAQVVNADKLTCNFVVDDEINVQDILNVVDGNIVKYGQGI